MQHSTRQCLSTETLADYIGERAAAVISEHYGGIKLYIPSKPRGELFADVCAKCGEEIALAFFTTFPSERLYIAKNDKRQQEQVAAQILKMRSEGFTYEQIARKIEGPPRRYSAAGIQYIERRYKQGQT